MMLREAYANVFVDDVISVSLSVLIQSSTGSCVLPILATTKILKRKTFITHTHWYGI